MAKIIKHGEKIWKCSRCGCEFEIEPKDIKMGYEEDGTLVGFMLGGVPCEYTLCPQCGKRILLNWL